METNLHHLYWTARDWRKYRLSSEIRNHELSKYEMVVGVHNELHAYVPPETAPSAAVGRMVLGNLLDLPDHYSALDASKLLVDELYGTEAQHISDHLYRQIPFLELSAKAMKRRHV